MLAWMDQHITAWVYLTAGVLSTAMLLLALGMSWRAGAPWPRWAIACWGGLSCGAWAGLSARNEWETASEVALMIALGAAALGFAVLLLAPGWIRRCITRRHRRQAQQSVGKVGKVYRTIAGPGQKGVVEIAGVSRFEARSAHPAPLPAFTAVKVIHVETDGLLVVKPVTT